MAGEIWLLMLGGIEEPGTEHSIITLEDERRCLANVGSGYWVVSELRHSVLRPRITYKETQNERCECEIGFSERRLHR